MRELSASEVKRKFESLFPNEPIMVRSPGRINLIGEHTDYNDGFVMPAAIDKEIFFAVAPSANDTSSVYSIKYNESYTVDLKDPQRTQSPGWANYLLGVIRKLTDEGYQLKPFNCVFGGNIPLGAGLSSSAAMECGFAFAMAELNNHVIPKQKLALMAQWAEHNYAGVKCGIMDQFASVMGSEDKVVMLDCRSLEYSYFPLELTHHTIVLCNSNVKHSLVDSEYNTRRHECEEGVRILQKHIHGMKSLRDISPDDVRKYKNELPGKVFDRCVYMTEEILRVQEASKDLQRGDIVAFGKKMYKTHEGLSKLYEVSCVELDFLVEIARQHHVVGARMMGGGFGGCTINIVENDKVDEFIEVARTAYEKKYGIHMEPYVVQIRNGTSIVSLPEKKFSL